MKPYRHEQHFGSVRAVYGRLPPSQIRLEPSVSAFHSIDFAFVGHEATLVRQSAGPVYARRIPAGTGGMHGGESLEFVEVDGPSEFIELSPVLEVRVAAADYFSAPNAVHFDEIQNVDDQVLWVVASRFRAHATGGWPLDSLEADELIRRLVGHLTCVYLGGRRSRRNDSRLPARLLALLRGYIESRLQDPLSVASLAKVVHRSPYHFMRTFTLTTGMSPHQYVKAVRMERAKALLLYGISVKAAAIAVGYAPGHNFRRAFHQHFGVPPSQVAAAWGGSTPI